jgi:hypothetical protein
MVDVDPARTLRGPGRPFGDGAKGLGAPLDQPLLASAHVRQELEDRTQDGKPGEKAQHRPRQIDVLYRTRKRRDSFCSDIGRVDERVGDPTQIAVRV